MLPEAVLHGDEKKRFAGWGFPVVLGFAFACGTNASTDAIVPFNRPYFYVQWLLFAVLFLVVFQVGFKIVQMGASSSLVKQVSEANTSSEKSSLLLFDYDQVQRFFENFGCLVTIYHSALSRCFILGYRRSGCAILRHFRFWTEAG